MEDAEWAALASASGLEDESDDADCQQVIHAVDAFATELAQSLARHMLITKSKLAQKAQARHAQYQSLFASERSQLEQRVDAEAAARRAVEQKLARAQIIQSKLADAIAAARDDAAARAAAQAVLAEWQRTLIMIKREVYCDRVATPHYYRTLMRKVIGQWRTSARKLRHVRIDQFWERSVLELRSALQAHYEPKLDQLHRDVMAARQETVAAHRAKEALGQELHAAFVRGVSQLNIETATIIGSGAGFDPEGMPRTQCSPTTALSPSGPSSQGSQRAQAQ